MAWTRFMDMHSGGRRKESFEYLYIEAPESEARSIFFSRFGHSPDRVTCTCCGEDYSVSESETLEQASGFDRGCKWDNAAKTYLEQLSDRGFGKTYQTVDEYLKQPLVAIIRADEIKPEERKVEVPTQGYVWRD